MANPLPQNSMARHVGYDMETLIIKGLHMVADAAPWGSEEREKASNYADALLNCTFLYESATGPDT